MFNSEIDREMRNRFVTQNTEKPKVKPDPIDYEKLSLYKIKELNPKLWREIYDEVYNNYQNEDGYYVSASGMYSSKSKRYFQIDHIVPLSKGGLTKVENLQLLTRWENAIKGDSMTFELKSLEEIKELEDDVKEQAAFDCLVNEEYEDSLKIIDSLLDNNKESISALNMKAKIALRNENYTNAIKIANRILNLDKDNEYALATKAHSYRRQGKYEKAIEGYEKIIDIYDDKLYAYLYLGDCYYYLKKYNLAISQYHNVLDINENMYDANFALGYLYSRNRRYELSNKYYEKAAKIEPECSSSLNNIGRNYFKLGDYERALEYYEKALEIDPDDELYINNRENVLEELGDNSNVESAQDKGIYIMDKLYRFDSYKSKIKFLKKLSNILESNVLQQRGKNNGSETDYSMPFFDSVDEEGWYLAYIKYYIEVLELSLDEYAIKSIIDKTYSEF